MLGTRYTARLKGDNDSDGGGGGGDDGGGGGDDDDDDCDVDIEAGVNGSMEIGQEEEDGQHHHHHHHPTAAVGASPTTHTSSVRVMLAGEAVQQWLAQHPEDRHKVSMPIQT